MVEKGVKSFYGLLENARGKCLHQMFNNNAHSQQKFIQEMKD